MDNEAGAAPARVAAQGTMTMPPRVFTVTVADDSGVLWSVAIAAASVAEALVRSLTSLQAAEGSSGE